ncbi:N-alpha-acetyltransferase 40 isoform X1 [Rhopalosiphum maidis]|uniref:N-alpha-acetyltransferase 40 isoform X1 n=2 Tax=Rhopalosiphum maidis TaxID=43146 RepID=UPI000EFDE8DE|nr:N-alpha-acetyltransferase 40 isoform X1 [Rhopalosiphum maidis]
MHTIYIIKFLINSFYTYFLKLVSITASSKMNSPKVNMSIQAAKKVNGLADPTKPFSSFMKYNKNDLEVTMHFIKAPAMTTFLKDKLYSMIKDNMMEAYKKCPWGWDGKKKRAELFHKDARYILVRHSSDNSLAAFVHFRFDIENLIEVLYLYELQIEKNVRGKGLGRYLMTLLETMAFHYKMKRIVLTVLKSDVNVVKFYFSLQYEIESYSPEDAFYYILSKKKKTLELTKNK